MTVTQLIYRILKSLSRIVNCTYL